MRHVVWIGLMLSILGGGIYFTVKYLHHGDVPVTEWEESVADAGLAYIDRDELYPQAASGILFTKDAFKKIHPDLSKTQKIDDVFRNGAPASRGWRIQGSKVRRIYWNERLFWESPAQELKKESSILRDILKEKRDSVGVLISPITAALTKDDFWNKSETIFGKDAFRKLHPTLTRTNDLTALFRDNPSGVNRGWTLKDGGPEIQRVYWNENSYWHSEWYPLEGNSYVLRGISFKAIQESWDNQEGDNWYVIFGIAFGEFLVIFIVATLGEAILGLDDWNAD